MCRPNGACRSQKHSANWRYPGRRRWTNRENYRNRYLHPARSVRSQMEYTTQTGNLRVNNCKVFSLVRQPFFFVFPTLVNEHIAVRRDTSEGRFKALVLRAPAILEFQKPLSGRVRQLFLAVSPESPEVILDTTSLLLPILFFSFSAPTLLTGLVADARNSLRCFPD